MSASSYSPRRVVPLLLAWLSRRPRWVLAVATVVLFAAWSGAAYLAWFARDLSTGLPDREAIRRIGDMAQATTIFDANGKPAFTIFKEQRIEVPLARMSPNLIKAIVAIEDQRFYEHRGVDVVRVLGAVAANLRQGRRAQGGSTITQQLARQSFLTRDKTLRRKLQEVILAQRLERTYSKDEILELYLNKVYFGDGLYGVEAASRGYFGKHAVRAGPRRRRRCSPASSSRRRATRRPSASSGRSRGATSCCRRWSTAARSTGRPGARGEGRARQARGRAPARGAARPVLQGAGAAGAGRAVRLAARVPGRAARLHDHRPGAAGSGGTRCRRAAEGRRSACAARAAAKRKPRKDAPAAAAGPAAAGRARRDRPGDRRRARDGRRPRLRARAASTAPCRRSASRAPRSSRSSTRPRSRPGSRRRRSSTISTIR